MATITKIQILTDSRLGGPILYSHGGDVDHNPEVNSAVINSNIVLTFRTLFKVKRNPATQQKNRIDVYMSIDNAIQLSAEIQALVAGVTPDLPQLSNADPNATRQGSMALPHIIWARYLRGESAEAMSASGLLLRRQNPYVNIDLEEPHATHVRMRDREVHLGIGLDAPSNPHDPSQRVTQIVVPDSELQSPPGRPAETNPVPKTLGGARVVLTPPRAAGLAAVLGTVTSS